MVIVKIPKPFAYDSHTHTHTQTHTLCTYIYTNTNTHVCTKDRSSVLGADLAVEELEKAIGALEYMKSRFSNSPTIDMSDELLSFFSNLMRVTVLCHLSKFKTGK